MKIAASKVAAAAMANPIEVFLSAGSNIDPARNLRTACAALRDVFGPLTVSSVYRNPAVGFDGDDFLNMAISFKTDESPEAVIEFLRELQRRAGRPENGGGFVPRTLDLDLLLYGEHIFEVDGIQIPRDDIERYGFVLGPLTELAPDLRHPVTGQRLQEIWDAFDQDTYPLNRLPASPL